MKYLKMLLVVALLPIYCLAQPPGHDTLRVRQKGRSVIVITPDQIDSSNYAQDSITPVKGPSTTQIGFTFSRASDSRVSAGLYRNGRLIRNIFSNVFYAAGSHSYSFPPVNDLLDTITSLSGCQIEVTSNNTTYTWDGVAGNTSNTNYGELFHGGYNQISGVAVTASKVFYTNEYNEFSPVHHYFTKINIQDRVALFPPGVTTYQRTIDMCTDGTNVYWLGDDVFAAKYGVTYKYADFVFGTKVSDNTQTAFSSGAPYKLSIGQSYSSAISFNSDSAYPAKGISVQQSGNLLFIARRTRIDVVNKTTGAPVTSNAFNASRLAAYGTTAVWVIDGTAVKKYSVTGGGVMTFVSSITSLSRPRALAINGDTLVVADGGTSQQVKAFSAITGAAYWTFGTAGGYYKSSAASNTKFYFDDDSAFQEASISYDASDGSMWVVDGGNYRLMHFTSGRQYIEHIQYVPNSYNVHCDPNDPTRVFVNYLEFTVDYTKPLQYGNGSWVFKANWYVDPLLLRNYEKTFTIRPMKFSNGRTYSLIQDNYGITYSGRWRFQVVELVGDSIRPTGTYLPLINGYLHHTDNDMYYMTRKIVGQPMVYYKKKLTGYSGNNPVWSSTDSVMASMSYHNYDPFYSGNPRTLRPGEKIGNNKILVFQGDNYLGFHVGLLPYGDTAFQWLTARSTHDSYVGNYPQDEAYDVGNGSQYYGAVALSLEDQILWGFHGEFWKNGQTNKWTHLAKNGLMEGQFGVVKADLSGYRSAQMAGNVSSASLVKVGDTLYLWHNDEGHHSGIHRWSIRDYDAAITDTVAATFVSVSTDTTITNLMDSLPYDAVLVDGVAGWHRSPATEITTDRLRDFWSVRTSLKSYSPFSNPDLYVDFANKYFQPVGNQLYKTLPATNQSTWSLSGKVTFDANTPSSDQIRSDTSGTGNIFLDVVDYNNKVLVRLYSKYDPSRVFIDYYANNILLFRDSVFNSNLTTKYWQNYSVTNTSGTLAISYAGHSLSGLSPLDGTANKSRPDKIRVYAWSKNQNYSRRIGLKDLIFDK